MEIKPLNKIQDAIRGLHRDQPMDLIVAIARGGIIPAVMIQAAWGGELEWLWLYYRNDDQVPIRPHPELVRPLTFDPRGRRILLVDDRSRTGQTLETAKSFLSSAASITTLVVNGVADLVLFNEDCFYFPWRMDIE
jgi:xanthine phosphoribosyltransferase